MSTGNEQVLQYNPRNQRPRNISIIYTDWNAHIVNILLEGCVAELRRYGVDLHLFKVPGAVEITYVAARLVASRPQVMDAVITLGCVVRGDTPHFHYVCQSVTKGITDLNSKGIIPVIFGVLTVDTEQQAFERCGGIHGHKGIEAAIAALKMAELDFNINY